MDKQPPKQIVDEQGNKLDLIQDGISPTKGFLTYQGKGIGGVTIQRTVIDGSYKQEKQFDPFH